MPSRRVPRPRPVAFALVLVLLGVAVPSLGAQPQRPDTVRFRFGWVPGSTVDVDYHKQRIRDSNGTVDTTASAWNFRLALARDGAGMRLGLQTLGREGDTLLVRESVGTPASALVIDPEDGEATVAGARGLASRIGPVLLSAIQPGAAAGTDLGEALERIGASDVLTVGAQAIWGHLVAFWWGASLPVGAEYQTEGRRDVPISPGSGLPTTLYFGATERVACRDGMADTTCVRLVIVEEANADSLHALLKRFLSMTGVRPDQATLSDLSMQRRFTMVVEPWSLFPYEYEEREEFGFTAIASGEGRIGFRQERSDWMEFRWQRARPALHQAAIAGDGAALRAGLRDLTAPELVDEVDEDGLTALYHAAAGGHEDAVRRLVEAKADARRAEVLARARGDVRAVQVLRRVARVAARAVATAALDSALRARATSAAIPLLVDQAASEAAPGPGHARLAEWLAYDRRPASAVALADRVLAARACDAAALRALRAAYDPLNGMWERASDSASAAAAARLVTCAPQLGDSWYGMAWHAARRGDLAAESAALDSLAAHPLFAPGQLALGRWFLGAVGSRDVLVANGAIDFVAMRLLQRQGVRPEVALLEWNALRGPAYVRAVRDRHALPLPFAELKLDARAAEDPPLSVELLTHWGARSREGSLGRGIALVASLDPEEYEGPGAFVSNGVHFVLADTGAASQPGPREALGRIRAALATVRGPMTVPDDPVASRPAYDVTRDVLGAGIAYLNSIVLDDLPLDAAEVAAADSLVAVLDAASAPLDWPGRDDLRDGLASSRMELRAIALRANDRAAMRRHAEQAAALAPDWAVPRVALANSALLARDPVRGVALAHEALERQRDLDGLLVAATALRLAGRPDSALALIAGARELLEEIPEGRRARFTARRLLHLPTGPADTTGAIEAYAVGSYAEAAAVVSYLRGMTEAVRQDFAAADAGIGWGRNLSVADGLRCFVRNQLRATRASVTLAPAAAEWFTRQEAQFPCRAP